MNDEKEKGNNAPREEDDTSREGSRVPASFNENDWRARRARMIESGQFEGDGTPRDGDRKLSFREGVRQRGFKDWFRSVFWFHYGRRIIIGVLAAVLLSVFIYDMATRKQPDFTYVFVSPFDIEVEELGEFTQLAEAVFGEGLEEPALVVSEIIPLNIANPIGDPMREKLSIMFFDKEICLFLLDGDGVEAIGDMEVFGFAEMADLGFAPVPDNPYLLRVDECPVFVRSGIPGPFYAALQFSPYEQEHDAAYAHRWERALVLLRELLEAP